MIATNPVHWSGFLMGGFSAEERTAIVRLQQMRRAETRLGIAPDSLTDREISRLRFTAWLIRHGRIGS